MTQPRWTWKFEKHIPSRTSAAEQIVEALLAQLEADAWDSQDRFGVHMAVEEALVNAIKHGNKEDASKRVKVRLRGTPEQVRIEITDEGPGFNPALVPDPTSDERLNQPHGRGLMLIRTFMTHVEYKGRGNHLVMEKVRKSAAA